MQLIAVTRSRAVALALVASALGSATDAHATDRRACFDAAESGQRQRKAGDLMSARSTFVDCADASCPDAVRSACTQWMQEIERSTPTVVVAAKSSCGDDLTEVRVTLDGAPWLERLDGHAVAANPGEHALVLTAAGHRSLQRTIVLNEGEKARLVELTLESTQPSCERGASVLAPTPAPKAAKSSGISPFAIAGLAVGGVGFATFGIAGALGHSEYSSLQTRCEPTCTSDQKSTVSTEFVVADVGLVVGIVGAAVATVFLLLPHDSSPPPVRAAWVFP